VAHIDEFFPSRWLKPSDLGGKDVSVGIQRVTAEEFENEGKTERKPVVYFNGAEKGLILNKTNAATITQAYGSDYTSWPGNRITLHTAMIDAWGETREAIRVRITDEDKHQKRNSPVKQIETATTKSSAHEEGATELPGETEAGDGEDLPF
jgi:hypothetical protein